MLLLYFWEPDDSYCLTVVGIKSWSAEVRSCSLLPICPKYVFLLQNYCGDMPLAKR